MGVGSGDVSWVRGHGRTFVSKGVPEKWVGEGG